MRYIRQQTLREIGKKGQAKLQESAVAIVGLGALGSVSSELLARAGVGKLILIDRDIVELSNLQRQGLFDESDIGKPKSAQAKEHLNKINSDVKVDFFIDDLNFQNIERILSNNTLSSKGRIDLLLDCTDNLETRFLLNDFCIKNLIPFIYSSAVGSKGCMFNIIPKKTPCLRCFLREAVQLDTCETLGVINTITNLISSLQVNSAIKILLKRGDFEARLLFFDIWKNELLKIKVNKNKNCICCANSAFEYLGGKKEAKIVKLCGNEMYQIKSAQMDKQQFNEIKSKLKKIGKIADFSYCINFDNKITLFNDGRALIKAKGEKEAKSLYSRLIGN